MDLAPNALQRQGQRAYLRKTVQDQPANKTRSIAIL